MFSLKTPLLEERCLEIAKNLNIFKESELKILEEVLNNCFSLNNGDYRIIYEERDNKIVGFIIFGKTSLTEFSWDIYWLAVDKEYQNIGIGKKLILMAEESILKESPYAIVRIETSSNPLYLKTQSFYKKMGFKEVGRIPNFYSLNDSLIIFYKELKRENLNIFKNNECIVF